MVGVSGVGSLPGTDFPAAVRMVFDTLGEVDGGLPHLPELPARGPWAGLVGRACAVLVDLPVSLDAGSWRLSDTAGIDLRRARATLRDDLDMLQEQAHDWAGRVKIQLAGPWTLAASVFRPLGGRVLGDRGARHDLAQSLAAGAAELLADVSGRLPAADVLLQLDEPSLPAVLTGRVPTEGGMFRHRTVHPPEVVQELAALAGLSAGSVLHCCAAGFDVRVARQAGFAAVALDQELTDPDAAASVVDGGTGLHLGTVPTSSERAWTADQIVTRAVDWLRPLELGEVLAERLVLTPACGLAGWSAAGASAVYRALARAASMVDESLRR